MRIPTGFPRPGAFPAPVHPQALLHCGVAAAMVALTAFWFVASGPLAEHPPGRGDGFALPAAPGLHASTSPALTIYVVDTEVDAVALRLALEDGNRIRAGYGLAPLLDEVAVAPAPGDAERLIQAIEDGNRIIIPGKEDVRVVNLVAVS